MRALCAFLLRDIQNEMSYRLSFFLQVFGILPVVLMFFFLSRLFGTAISGPLQSYGGQYFPFVLIGVAVQYYLTIGLSSFSTGLRESQLSGTLEAVLVAPIRLPVFFAGSTLYAFVLNSFRILVYLLVGDFFFGASFHWTRLPEATLVLVLTVASFSCLGILSASYLLLFKKGDPVNWAINTSSWLLGGVYYPISVLPGWVQKLSLLVPMTHSLECFRLTLLGNRGLTDMGSHLAILGVWTVLGLPLSLLCLRCSVNRARIKGNLGHY